MRRASRKGAGGGRPWPRQRVLPHADVHAAAGAYALDALPTKERLAFEQHLAACEACQVDLPELRASLVALSQAVAQPAPVAARERVLAQVDVTRQVPPLPRVAAEAPAARSGRWTQLVAAVAALLAVGVLLTGGAAIRLSEQVAELEVQAGERQLALSRQVADLQAEAGDTEQLATLLTAPDVRTVALDAPAGTTARVLSDGRGRGLLVADGLAVPPGSTAYQLWLLDGPQARSAGVFLPAAGEPTVVPLRGQLAQAERVAVTIEPSGGSPAPTSPIIMAAALPRGR